MSLSGNHSDKVGQTRKEKEKGATSCISWIHGWLGVKIGWRVGAGGGGALNEKGRFKDC